MQDRRDAVLTIGPEIACRGRQEKGVTPQALLTTDPVRVWRIGVDRRPGRTRRGAGISSFAIREHRCSRFGVLSTVELSI